jgi:hypothetical protein
MGKQHPPRAKVVEYLRSVLIGPREGSNEIVQGTPFLRYMCGILFPLGGDVRAGTSTVTATADEEPTDTAGSSEAKPESVELAFEALAAAVGISLRVDDTATLECNVSAAAYEKQAGETRSAGRSAQAWKRIPLADDQRPLKVQISKHSSEQTILGDRARLDTRWRTMADGTAIVTLTLINQQKTARGLDPALALFQVGLSCRVLRDGSIRPYQDVTLPDDGESEESEVSFLYRHSAPYARGHGCAADWDVDEVGTCARVFTNFVPSAHVPAATFVVPDASVDRNCLSVRYIDEAERKYVLAALSTIVPAYRSWIDDHKAQAGPASLRKVAQRFTRRAEEWLKRIQGGIDLLARDSVAWESFKLANRAMGMQMVLSSNLENGPYPHGASRKPPRLSFEGKTWRPFQVAFVLATIESLVEPNSAARDVVDVIWFPTGGGKTEAYLFLSAFELVRRRLAGAGSDTATGILSRYTLRLLTAQQFQRTAALITAMEVVRRSDASRLGSRPFSLGLWVGKDSTPNTYREAHGKYELMLEQRAPNNPFILEACPWCATEIIPSSPKTGNRPWGKENFGIRSTQSEFAFHCPNTTCEFHDFLPLNVVDQALYATPPSILLGTMDKFAQLAWKDSARAFFGGPDDSSIPPSLVVQDELHLISGPLGSISAPYEAAIDAVITVRGSKPKRIASTATIRNAAEQVRGLYGRPVAVFPAPCGSWDDAFFFRTEPDRPGREYVGVMGQGYIKPVVAMAWTAAALLQSVREVPLGVKDKDAYWTLLAYHNSRRELGRTLTAARDEIATRIKTIASSPALARELREPLELSSSMVKSMTEALAALNRKHDDARPAVDFVPCTSIVSVGVDVQRLGVMLVNGQPKLTSEYIQATSRVGRGDVPGLVIALYSGSKPRDRSHYEDFRAYHEAIYRHVEPTSVTPYALPARERTVHAALVAVVRNALQWCKFDDAGRVDFEDPATKRVIAELEAIMAASDPSEASNVKRLLAGKIADWIQFAEANNPLLYENLVAGAQFPALLSVYGQPPGLGKWQTMMSVRNVDREVTVGVS